MKQMFWVLILWITNDLKSKAILFQMCLVRYDRLIRSIADDETYASIQR